MGERIVYTVCAALFGLVIGSFLNVCIYRIPAKISLSKGRSFCPTCKTPIKNIDLIPIFSFLFLGAKCRSCKSRISSRYPLIELLNALLWAASIWVFGLSFDGVIFCIFFSILIVAAMIDIDIQEIPYRLQVMILTLAVANFIYKVFIEKSGSWSDYLIGLVVISVPMLLITLLLGAFGGADIQLMAVSGLLLGTKNIVVAAAVGVICGAIYGIIFMIARKKNVEIPEQVDAQNEDANLTEQNSEKLDDAVSGDTMLDSASDKDKEETEADSEKPDEDEPKGTKISFGPCLAAGLVVAVFFGQKIADWYLNFMNL